MTTPTHRVSERFWKKVVTADRGYSSPCFIWTGTKSQWGYGIFGVGGKNIQAHRFSYQEVRGQIPAGLVIDHLCRVHDCVNPAHLEAVTNNTNILRGIAKPAINARKQVCQKGHPFEPRPNGNRMCRACTNDKHTERLHRKIASGICQRCPAPRTDRRFCDKHRAAFRKYERERKQALRDKAVADKLRSYLLGSEEPTR